MGWSLGYDTHWGRDIGYSVPAFCDHPRCKAVIDRGLAYVCGNAPYGGDTGCGLYFCAKHQRGADQLCARCTADQAPFKPKPEHPDWLRAKRPAEITFTVYGKAQPKGSTRAFPFKDKLGRLRVNVTSDNPNLAGWERLVKFEAKAALRKAGYRDQVPPFEGPVALRLRFGLPRPRSSRRAFPVVKPDLDKLIRAAVDPLIGVMFKDDAQVCKFHEPEKFYVDDARAYAEITVTEHA